MRPHSLVSTEPLQQCLSRQFQCHLIVSPENGRPTNEIVSVNDEMNCHRRPPEAPRICLPLSDQQKSPTVTLRCSPPPPLGAGHLKGQEPEGESPPAISVLVRGEIHRNSGLDRLTPSVFPPQQSVGTQCSARQSHTKADPRHLISVGRGPAPSRSNATNHRKPCDIDDEQHVAPDARCLSAPKSFGGRPPSLQRQPTR
jgi:hypothetical protein